MELKHNYRREKVYIPLSEKAAVTFGHPEWAHRTFPYMWEWRLYDGDKCVLVEGCKCLKAGEKEKQLADQVDEEFFARMSNYIDTHKYFNPVLWIIEKLYPVKVEDEF